MNKIVFWGSLSMVAINALQGNWDQFAAWGVAAFGWARLIEITEGGNENN